MTGRSPASSLLQLVLRFWVSSTASKSEWATEAALLLKDLPKRSFSLALRAVWRRHDSIVAMIENPSVTPQHQNLKNLSHWTNCLAENHRWMRVPGVLTSFDIHALPWQFLDLARDASSRTYLTQFHPRPKPDKKNMWWQLQQHRQLDVWPCDMFAFGVIYVYKY